MLVVVLLDQYVLGQADIWGVKGSKWCDSVVMNLGFLALDTVMGPILYV